MGLTIRMGVLEGEVERIARALMAFDRKTARRAIRKAVNEASKLVARRAKSTVPKKTRQLARSIGRKIKKYRDGRVVEAFVGPRFGFRIVIPAETINIGGVLVRRKAKTVDPVKYAHFTEYGTRPHALGAGSSLKRGIQHGPMHPGVRAKPWLRPAWFASIGPVREQLRRTLAYELLTRFHAVA